MTVGVLLAAGEGRRLGRGPKALLRHPGGPPLVRQLTEVMLAGGCEEVVVVAGAGAEDVQHALAQVHCRVVVNEDWASGLGSSFRRGIDAASGLAADSMLIALVDQPGMTSDVVKYLREHAAPERVTAAAYPNPEGRLVRGHPLIFPAAFAREAAATAEGDAGARAWLRAHTELMDLIDVGHLATGRDIDTASDLDDWLNTTGATR